MKTIAIKMKTYATGVNIVNNSNLESRMLNLIFAFFGLLALCYVLILGNMIFNILQRKTVESDVRTLSNEVGNLEVQYLSMSDKVDLAYAESIGFKQAKIKFATRKSLGSLKIQSNEL